MPYCDICEGNVRGPLASHDKTKAHLDELQDWKDMMWYAPGTFSKRGGGADWKPFHWEFMVSHRRPVKLGISLWELLQHWNKDELHDVAKKLGVKTTLKAQAFKVAIWQVVNAKAKDLEALRDCPPGKPSVAPPTAPTKRQVSSRKKATPAPSSPDSSDVAEDSDGVPEEFREYCGRKYCAPNKCKCGKCNGTCGPSNGCQCADCETKTAEKVMTFTTPQKRVEEVEESSEEDPPSETGSSDSEVCPRKKAKKQPATKCVRKKKGEAPATIEKTKIQDASSETGSSDSEMPCKKKKKKQQPATKGVPVANTVHAAVAECKICSEPFGSKNGPHKKCTCPYCADEYCQSCICQWLLASIEEPRCMNDECMKPWSQEFIDSCVYKVWRNKEYKEHRSKVLFDREKALLPATQPKAERRAKVRRTALEISQIEAEIDSITQIFALRGQQVEDLDDDESYDEEEEEACDSGSENDVEGDGFAVGDQVWILSEGYPWWPGRIVSSADVDPVVPDGYLAATFYDITDLYHVIAPIANFMPLEFESDKAGVPEIQTALALAKADVCDDAADVEEGGFDVGDQVWIRVEGYPWWPGRIVSSADVGEAVPDGFLAAEIYETRDRIIAPIADFMPLEFESSKARVSEIARALALAKADVCDAVDVASENDGTVLCRKQICTRRRRRQGQVCPSFHVDDQVWFRLHTGEFWPAKILDPRAAGALGSRIRVPEGHLIAMFYGSGEHIIAAATDFLPLEFASEKTHPPHIHAALAEALADDDSSESSECPGVPAQIDASSEFDKKRDALLTFVFAKRGSETAQSDEESSEPSDAPPPKRQAVRDDDAERDAARAELADLRGENVRPDDDDDEEVGDDQAPDEEGTSENNIDETETLKQKYFGLVRRLEELRNETDDAPAPPEEERERKKFIRRCPAPNCRGFLSSAWKCGICAMFSCPECQEVKGASRDVAHTCDPGALATARLIAHDTKACPKCGELITKIDGCDQMFCVMCHTAFSWVTGKVITGMVHNPHYFEWQQRNGGAHQAAAGPQIQGACGQQMQWGDFHRKLTRNGTVEEKEWMGVVELAFRRVGHVADIDMGRLTNPNAINDPNANEELRIQYLLNEISDIDLMSHLQKIEKKQRREIELRRIYETLTGAATDIFHRMSTKACAFPTYEQEEEEMLKLCRELDCLRRFVNEALDVLRRRYDIVLKGFCQNWSRRLVLRVGGEDRDTCTTFGILVAAMDTVESDLRDLLAMQHAVPYGDRPLGSQLRRVMTAIDDLPQCGSQRTRRLAATLRQCYDMANHFNLRLQGPGWGDTDEEKRSSETRHMNAYRAAKSEWDAHKVGLTLAFPRVNKHDGVPLKRERDDTDDVRESAKRREVEAERAHERRNREEAERIARERRDALVRQQEATQRAAQIERERQVRQQEAYQRAVEIEREKQVRQQEAYQRAAEIERERQVRQQEAQRAAEIERERRVRAQQEAETEAWRQKGFKISFEKQ